MKRVYSWSRSYAVDAQVVGEIYYSLPTKTPEELLKVAAKKQSAIHSLFNWDDAKAAHEYRLVQARVMVNSLQVEITSIEGKQDRVQAFIGSSDRGSHVCVFEATEAELTENEQEFIREINGIRKRWKSLQLAHAVIQAIDSVNQRAARRQRRSA